MYRRAIDTPYFYGNRVSDYGIEQGFVDYRTLAQAFDAVMNNGIIEATAEIGFWEQVHGWDLYDSEVFQYFIISKSGAEILEMWTDDPVFYNEELDMYVWGVTHWGTSWDYVLTDIAIDPEEYEREIERVLKEV